MILTKDRINLSHPISCQKKAEKNRKFLYLGKQGEKFNANIHPILVFVRAMGF